MSLETGTEQILPHPDAGGTGRHNWQSWVDRLLVIAWVAASGAFLIAAGRELWSHLGSVQWNSMWESGPLQVALDAAKGRPMYGNWHEGPVHLAIYGPLYYWILGVLSACVQGDRAAMTLAGRWAGIVFLGLGLVGVAGFIRSQGGRWWAAVIGAGCAVSLLTPTALRFVAGARPDAMAAALSALGLTAIVSRRRGGAMGGAALLSAAWLTKVTAVAAPLTTALMLILLAAEEERAGSERDGGGDACSPGTPPMLPLAKGGKEPPQPPFAKGGRGRRLVVAGTLFLLINAIAVVGLSVVTGGWFGRHLAVASSAPVGPRYAWFMLTHRPYEPQVRYLFVFSALAILTAVMIRDRRSSRAVGATREGDSRHSFPGAQPGWAGAEHGGQPLRIAGLYVIVSLAVALVTAMHQGSDRNYLIEPALAMGMLAGAWAGRVADLRSRREWLITRTVAVLACFSPMLLAIPDQWARSSSTTRGMDNALSPYHADAFDWVRALPQPVLCLDSWLAWRAGLCNDLSDSIPYISYVVVGGSDPVAQRAARGQYACIVTMAPAEGDNDKIYGDIGSLWPGLREVIRTNYHPASQHGPWYAYTRKGLPGVPP